MQILGVDIGGSGVKGAVVDTERGELASERVRIPTPKPATPASVVETVAALVSEIGWRGPLGCGFPGVVQHGSVHTAANLHRDWIGTDGRGQIESATGCATTLLNDADAAGLAEMRFGAGRDRDGSVLVVTLGTGIGSALFNDGRLVPNTELGHIELNGGPAEEWAAERIRDEEDLSWKKWAKRVDAYLHRIHFYLWPELIVIGGGVSKKHERFVPLLTVPTEVVPAELRNAAGIIGAALAARES